MVCVCLPLSSFLEEQDPYLNGQDQMVKLNYKSKAGSTLATGPGQHP